MSRFDSSLWQNNEIQFARLLCEIVATQELDYTVLQDSMDLTDSEIDNLLDRASDVWERSKEMEKVMALKCGESYAKG